MLTSRCHCGAVEVRVPRRPRSLTSCNCSICRRYGALWAYYRTSDVHVLAPRGATERYVWGDRTLAFIRCGTCGCVMAWQPLERGPASRMGVNARNFDPADVAGIRVRRLDGASTWKVLD